MKQKFKLTTTLGVMTLFSVSLFLGFGYMKQVKASPGYQYLDLFTKVLHFVQSNYVEEIDNKKLMEGAIKGMLRELDPHTAYLPPEAYEDMQEDTSGEFGGLGIEISIQDDILTVVTPIEDTPAFAEGVEPGDKIYRIEDKKKDIDQSTKGMSLHEAVKLLRGKAGTPVTIHVMRQGSEKLIPIEIKRAVIKVVSVKSGLIEKDYAWLRITSFQSNTSRDLRNHIEKAIKNNKSKFKSNELKGVVLDLRSNPGGLLEEAVNVSGLFLDKLPIVSTIGRNKKKKEVEYSNGKNPYKDFKVVVLVNQASASASEIVTGALQDHKRALVVGKKTFGKGSVQTVIDLGNNAGLKLTVARYYTPSGRAIQSVGIDPDIEVDQFNPEVIEEARKNRYLSEADLKGHIKGDEEKEKENQERKDKRPIKEKDGKKIRVDDPAELVKTDYQLQQALNYLKAWGIFVERAGDMSTAMKSMKKSKEKK